MVSSIKKLFARVASWVTKIPDLRKLANIKGISKLGVDFVTYLVFPPEENLGTDTRCQKLGADRYQFSRLVQLCFILCFLPITLYFFTILSGTVFLSIHLTIYCNWLFPYYCPSCWGQLEIYYAIVTFKMIPLTSIYFSFGSKTFSRESNSVSPSE